MRKYIIFLLLITCYSSYGQSRETYLEHTGDNQTKFYFDNQYYLVDKDCEFLSIIRVSAFNKEKNTYEGLFTDYDINGSTILTGNYLNGEKNGTFKSFYPNGFLKWQGEYDHNKLSGTWNFYYPDGKPKTIIEMKKGQTYIMYSWNEKGKQVITDGHGKFTLDDYLSDFNELGYNGLRYSGKIENGVPDESWLIEFIYPKNETEAFTFRSYLNGEPLFPDNQNKVKLMPTEYHPNSEKLISKKCTIDDNSGFTMLLQNKINAVFNLATVIHEDVSQPLEISLTVNKKGQPSEINIYPWSNTTFYTMLKEVLGNIRYWIPSQVNGKVIEDTLTITTQLYFKDQQSPFYNGKIQGKPSFSLPVIQRLKGK